jgi:hypothetical protein
MRPLPYRRPRSQPHEQSLQTSSDRLLAEAASSRDREAIFFTIPLNFWRSRHLDLPGCADLLLPTPGPGEGGLLPAFGWSGGSCHLLTIRVVAEHLPENCLLSEKVDNRVVAMLGERL